MLTLAAGRPDAALRQIETFGARKYVTRLFMITCVRSLHVHHHAHIKIYRAEERASWLSFIRHQSGSPFQESQTFRLVHALGGPVHNILQFTNWVTNGLANASQAAVIWIEGGIAWSRS